jgi:hypothetical protein
MEYTTEHLAFAKRLHYRACDEELCMLDCGCRFKALRLTSHWEENQSLVRIPLAQPQHRVRVRVALQLVNYYIGLARMRFRVSRMRSAVGKYRISFFSRT